MQSTNAVQPLVKTIIGTFDFLNEVLIDVVDGQEKTDMIDSRCKSLVQLIGNLEFDLDDATAGLKAVREHISLIGADNVDTLRKAINRSSGAPPCRLTSKKAKVSYVAQDHMHIESYYPDKLWQVQQSDRQMHEKLLAVAKLNEVPEEQATLHCYLHTANLTNG